MSAALILPPAAATASKWKVPYVNLPRQYEQLRSEILAAVDSVFSEARFILRDDVAELEARLAAMIGVRHVIGVNSGTDALMLAVRALGIGSGDEVITVAHTFVATVGAIVHAGASPVLIDAGTDFNMDIELIERHITPRTRAILPVHMNGRCADMPGIMSIARRHGLVVIEDAAQGLGAAIDGRQAGSFGSAGCFSLHPMKNLGIGGDGGFISTNDDDLASALRILRAIGHRTKEEIVSFGFNSRLDTLHAAVALVKLPHLEAWLSRRRYLAGRYDKAFAGIDGLVTPPRDDRYDVYSSYVIRSPRRDALKAWLLAAGIEVFVHWPVALNRQTALGFGNLSLPNTEQFPRDILSLPIVPEMTDAEQDLVIAATRDFFGL